MMTLFLSGEAHNEFLEEAWGWLQRAVSFYNLHDFMQCREALRAARDLREIYGTNDDMPWREVAATADLVHEMLECWIRYRTRRVLVDDARMERLLQATTAFPPIFGARVLCWWGAVSVQAKRHAHAIGKLSMAKIELEKMPHEAWGHMELQIAYHLATAYHGAQRSTEAITVLEHALPAPDALLTRFTRHAIAALLLLAELQWSHGTPEQHQLARTRLNQAHRAAEQIGMVTPEQARIKATLTWGFFTTRIFFPRKDLWPLF